MKSRGKVSSIHQSEENTRQNVNKKRGIFNFPYDYVVLRRAESSLKRKLKRFYYFVVGELSWWNVIWMSYDLNFYNMLVPVDYVRWMLRCWDVSLEKNYEHSDIQVKCFCLDWNDRLCTGWGLFISYESINI